MLSKYPSTGWPAGLPWWLSGEEYSCNAGATGDSGLILGLGRSPGGGTVTHSSTLAWRIPWTEEPQWAAVQRGCKESDTTEVTLHTCLAGGICF